MKKIPRDIILLYIYVYHKWRSYNIWFLKYKVQQTGIFLILGHFCPFSTLTTQKIKNWKKHLQVLSFCTFAPQWCMVPEMWSATDIIFSHSELFFAFTPCGSRKSKFWKNEKTTQDIILQMCTINDSHMMYDSSGMECNKQNFMSF